MAKQQKKLKGNETKPIFLDPQILDDFRQAINTSSVFYADKEHKPRWSLICAVMDRIQSCVAYLNDTNKNKFDTEEEFVNFLNYCCIIQDGIKELLKQTHIDYPYKNSSEYLNGIYNDFIKLYAEDRPQYKVPTTVPTDDRFFAFIRSLAFAHPLETNRATFIEHGETLYSPFVLVNRFGGWDIKNPVGLNIYSNKIENTLHLWFSLDTIKAYINSRYELLNIAKQWVHDTIQDFEAEWSKKKVNRDLPPIAILQDICNILVTRYQDTYEIVDAITMLECSVSNKENENIVNQYKQNIIKYIPQLCDWIDVLQDEESYPNEFFTAVSGYPKEMHNQAGYQLEKIFGYLNDDVIDFDRYIRNREYFIRTANDNKMCNYDWGLIQAEFFFKEFGGQYIKYEYDKISSATEIKLLVNTALFCERENQRNGKVSDCIIKSRQEYAEHMKQVKSKTKSVGKKTITTPDGDKIVLNFVDASGSDDSKK